MTTLSDVMEDVDRTTLFHYSRVYSAEDCKSKLDLNNAGLTIVTQNIRSINKNLRDFETYLARLNFEPDIIVLTECWLHEKYTNFDLPNYKYHPSRNYLNQNDGIVIYSKTNINVSVNEPIFQHGNCMVLTIGSDISVVAIYRSPNFKTKAQMETFFQSMDNVLTEQNAKTCICTGDINIDITEGSTDNNSDKYLNLLAFHGYSPAFTEPTHGHTCIDHMSVKTSSTVHSIVCESTITDHYTILASFNTTMVKPNTKPRNKIKTNLPLLSQKLAKYDWNNLYNTNDPTLANEIFTNTFKSLIDDCSNLYTTHNRHSLKAWVTPGLIRCIRKRDRLHRAHKLNINDENLKNVYLKYRNTCNFILQNRRNQYNSSRLQQNIRDPKKTWYIIKNICNIDTPKATSHDLRDLGKTVEESSTIVNNYFTSIGYNLARSILESTKVTESDLIKRISNISYNNGSTFYLHPTDPAEITRLIQTFKTDGAPGWDGIMPKALKEVRHLIAEPLAHIINLSIASGCVPANLKIAQVCPIFKSGNRKDVNNYRPISLLTLTAKILEKVVNKRLLSFLEQNSVLAPNQYGFRAKKSTEDAVVLLTDTVAQSLDSGDKCIGVFLDLKKAFDTVSIPLLLSKLEAMGVRGVALSWFESYLTGRAQFVRMDDCSGETGNVIFGVPQGSVLGPTLFLVYINDLCRLGIGSASIVTFADDTAIIFRGKAWAEVKSLTEVGMTQVANWLENNLLTLNTSKTKYLCFHITKKTSPPDDLCCLKIHSPHCRTLLSHQCNCQYIDRCSQIKYLGIILDEKLNWKPHIDSLVSKTRKLLHIFKKLRNATKGNLLKIVYFSLCQSILTYGIVVWGSAAKTILLKLERAQRSALKVIFNKKFRYPTFDLYSLNRLLTVRQLYTQKVTLRFHKQALGCMLPSQTAKCLRTIPSRERPWMIPRTKTAFSRRFYYHMGPFVYTKTNNELQILTKSTYQTKKSLFRWLIAKTYMDTETFLNIPDS